MRYNCNASEPLMCVPFCAHEPRCGLEVWKRVFATPPPPRGGGVPHTDMCESQRRPKVSLSHSDPGLRACAPPGGRGGPGPTGEKGARGRESRICPAAELLCSCPMRNDLPTASW